MPLTRWLHAITGLWTTPRPTRNARASRPTHRLYVEPLEGRMLLSGGPGGPSIALSSPSDQLVAAVQQTSTPGGPGLVSGSSSSNNGGGGSGGSLGGPSAVLVSSGSGSSGGPSGGSSGGGSSGGSGSAFLSGPGYPLVPATGPTLQGDLTTSTPPIALAIPDPQSLVALIPVLVTGSDFVAPPILATTVSPPLAVVSTSLSAATVQEPPPPPVSSISIPALLTSTTDIVVGTIAATSTSTQITVVPLAGQSAPTPAPSVVTTPIPNPGV